MVLSMPFHADPNVDFPRDRGKLPEILSEDVYQTCPKGNQYIIWQKEVTNSRKLTTENLVIPCEGSPFFGTNSVFSPLFYILYFFLSDHGVTPHVFFFLISFLFFLYPPLHFSHNTTHNTLIIIKCMERMIITSHLSVQIPLGNIV